MMKGTVEWFDDKKGYGFLSREDGGHVFVHSSAIQYTDFKTLIKGQEVEFEVQDDPKLPIATKVRPLQK